MAEPIIPIVEPIAQPTLEPTPEPSPGNPTPSSAVNVDIEAITRIATEKAEQKMTAVFKSMLQQQQPDMDTETINAMIAEFKSKQVTPETKIAELNDTIAKQQAQIETASQRELAISKGIPLTSTEEAIQSKVEACMTLAKSYVSETVDFSAALDKALQIVIFEQEKEKPPMFYAGTGKQPVANSETEQFRNAYNDAQKNKNSAEMSRLTREAQKKGIRLF